MNCRRTRNLRVCGFTFVEIMIVMVLAVGIVSIIFTFNLLTRKTEADDSVDLALQQRARIAMEYIIRDLRAVKRFEEIQPTNISFERFSRAADIYLQLGSVDKVGYVLKKRADGDDILVRFEKDRNHTLLKFPTIETDLFRAYYDDDAASLKEFEYDDNPSDHRAKVSLVRVHIGAGRAGKKVDLYSDVTIRYIWARNKQPHWNPVHH